MLQSFHKSSNNFSFSFFLHVINVQRQKKTIFRKTKMLSLLFAQTNLFLIILEYFSKQLLSLPYVTGYKQFFNASCILIFNYQDIYERFKGVDVIDLFAVNQ